MQEMERRRAVSAGVKRLNEMALVSGTAHADSHAKLNNRIQSAPVIRHMKTTSTTIQILDNSKPPRPVKPQRKSENKENIGSSSNVSSAKDSELRRNKSVSMKEKDERVQRIPSSTKFTFPTPVNYSTPVSHWLPF